ncbi:hypothetical protein SAMN05444161_7315 [Rhizobiales bacterium GAS191]|jgi:hypothetical protein|nr:hypothetical protein SAMN05519103_06665 [Rhizobiales bacterium GAS113]SED70139.1 hypothetical protein SAMN05519104_4128 [Rhizobiales bacterium GAS188]SEE82316.1 hypothetical protein SAMN05444161_7315 [Rhizobiales bacterium GAS191]
MKIHHFLLAALLVGVVFGAAAVQGQNAQARAPAYAITEMEVTDAEAHAVGYVRGSDNSHSRTMAVGVG